MDDVPRISEAVEGSPVERLRGTKTEVHLSTDSELGHIGDEYLTSSLHPHLAVVRASLK
jgi:hypothetical protein